MIFPQIIVNFVDNRRLIKSRLRFVTVPSACQGNCAYEYRFLNFELAGHAWKSDYSLNQHSMFITRQFKKNSTAKSKNILFSQRTTKVHL